ncbi:helix-turn-helix domain-containing protein [Paenarthrobacter nitroguajacolicus]|uniref:AraC-like ligand-binding domain-containing protein n=1 Tax=Paenarthrobacter nitroguajacolicus TaxID=211146 RepID=UPI00248BBF6C|nr:helix-turn-helix domain-containing protein [Paenarthrobacter nitroguajacolicus]MDI2036466.1 Transcriptional activator NphR [Paenarthrobacter nitroguajacolicus]
MARIVRTSSIPARNRVAFWTESVSEAFVSLECKAGAGHEDIQGELSVQSLASLDLARVRASAQAVHRTSANIRSSQEDFYLVGVQTQGSCVVTQAGRSAVIADGAFALYDTSRPYSLELTDRFEQLVLRLPRAAFETHLPGAEGLTAQAVIASPGAARILVNTVKMLADDIEFLTPAAALAVSHGLEHLIVAGLRGLTSDAADDSSTLRKEIIQRYIMDNLRDDSLSIANISQQLHLSPSSIHRSFALQGQTVMGWVWRQRLEGIRRELLAGSHKGTLSQLAYSWGFSDSAHFSRAFRRQYGQAPSSLQRPLT